MKSWFIIYVFVLYKLFYTHNRSKGTGHFNAKSFRKCTHSERGGSHLEWTASLRIFSVPALWNSSPTAHHNDATLHSPKQQEISVDKPNTTHKLVIMWKVTSSQNKTVRETQKLQGMFTWMKITYVLYRYSKMYNLSIRAQCLSCRLKASCWNIVQWWLVPPFSIY